MSAKISGHEAPIGKIFSDDFVFTIPTYQRPYSWEKEQATELLDDLLQALGTDNDPIEELNPYFLGSIVLIKADLPPAEVVDGQQRLTTLVILLAALRELAPKDEADELTTYIYEKAKKLSNIPDRFRLSVRSRDADFFQDFIQKETGFKQLKNLTAVLTDPQMNMRDNALDFLTKLERVPEAVRLRLASFVVSRCYLIVVTTPDFAAAYRIFSILNDRGLNLSNADILKAAVIGEIPEDLQDEYTAQWESCEERLGLEAFRGLFGHIRMIYTKKKLASSVLQEIRENVKPAAEPTEFIDRVLVPMADAYEEILNASYKSTNKAEEINRVLGWLHRVDNADWQPAAILFLSSNHNAPGEILRFFTDLERLAAGLMIYRGGVNDRISRYGSLIASIEASKDLYAADSPLQLSAEERQWIRDALDGSIYGVSQTRLFILLRLDEAVAGAGAVYDRTTVTIEHVLPQTPAVGSKWLDWWPDPTTRDWAVHRLGNLALLDRRKNPQAQNFDFDRKKTEYFLRKGVTPFPLTSQVLAETEWTPAVFEKRQKELFAKLCGVWRLN
jgi:hypothetical protein